MTTRTKFILTVVALLTLFLVIEYRMPRKFVWEPTFAHQDPQPFGCLVFDSVLAASMPQGYTVEQRTLWQLENDSVFTTPKAVLIITEEDIDAQIGMVLDLAHQGHTMLVAVTDLYHWCDTLGIDYEYNRSFKLADIAGKRTEKGLLRLVGNAIPADAPTRSLSQHCVVGEASKLCVVGEASKLCVVGEASKLCNTDSTIEVYQQMIERTLTIPDTVSCDILATFIDPSAVSEVPEVPAVPEDSLSPETSTTSAIAAAFPIGKGELILVSAPLLLTNYGMVSGDGHRFIAHLMNRVKHLPVIRTESYMAVTAHTEQSPFYVLLQKPPLRWAVYLTMLTLLLFCIFTARRRQRVIPIITKPRNANLEFVRLIGTLYWQRHDNADLLAKKLAFTTDEIRRQTGLDISSQFTDHSSQLAGRDFSLSNSASTDNDDAIRQLATLTGRDPEELRLLLSNIRQAASGNYAVSDPALKTFIDQLNSLMQST